LLRSAPLLRVLHADVYCGAGQEATRLLRNKAPFGPLRVRRLYALCRGLTSAQLEAAVMALAAGIAVHDTLSSLRMLGAPLNVRVSLDAVVDAVLLRRVRSVQLNACCLSPASAPALARLLRGSILAELHIWNDGRQLLDAPAAALLADALRANSTLKILTLEGINMWRDAAAGETLLGALAGHPSLRKLGVHDNAVGAHTAVAAAALSALVTANAPALRKLNMRGCHLGDDGLGPLVDALPANTHLHTLRVRGNDVSKAFVRHRLLPAVRANISLRALVASSPPGAAEALVAARAAADAA
jgi:hypothetical protein